MQKIFSITVTDRNRIVLLLFITHTTIFFSCKQAALNRATQQKDSLLMVIESLATIKDSLLTVLTERDSFLNDFITTFSEVEKNLDSISGRQQLINMTAAEGELNTSQKARINAGIATINTLMDENRKKITELNRKLKTSSVKNLQLEKMVASMNQQLAQKNTELTALNEKLNTLNTRVTHLQTSVDTLYYAEYRPG